MQIAYVKWRDAVQEMGDNPDAPSIDIKDPLVTLEAVGWLMGESDDSVSLAMEYEPNSQTWGRWRVHIPKVGIQEIRVLEFDKFPKRKTKIK